MTCRECALYSGTDKAPPPHEHPDDRPHTEAGRLYVERLRHDESNFHHKGPALVSDHVAEALAAVLDIEAELAARPAVSEALDVEAIEADARQRTGHPRFGCIPAWAWRGAILAASATDEGRPRAAGTYAELLASRDALQDDYNALSDEHDKCPAVSEALDVERLREAIKRAQLSPLPLTLDEQVDTIAREYAALRPDVVTSTSEEPIR